MKKNLHSHKITFLVTGISFALLPMEYAEAMNTQIQTDSTLSGISAMAIDSQSGNQIYTLSEINGKTVGSNLFYSFSNFSIGATDTAWFNLNTPDLANVISRVTGGAESIIDGHLQMTNVGSAPSFFFINPAGVTFGAGASVDVPGSFYVSTASGLNMSDGSVYAAHEAQASTLSAAEPESFGFLGDESGSINLSGLETDNVELTFKPGTDVGLIGNNVHIKNSHISSTALADGNLTQEGLNIQIAATGEESVNFNFANLNTKGNLVIENSHIEASGNGSGFLGIRAGDFKTTDSFLFVDNTGEIPMAENHGIVVSVNSLLVLDHSIISSDALGAAVSSPDQAVKGNAGSVIVSADIIEMNNGGNISSSTFADGNAGRVIVVANTINIDGSGFYPDINGNPVPISSGISSRANISSHGSAGSIAVITDSLTIVNDGSITNFTEALTEGESIAVVVINANSIRLDNGGNISSSTAGNNDAGVVIMSGLDSNLEQEIFTDAESITITNGGFIDSSTIGDGHGNAGSIHVQAKQITIDGQGETKSATGIVSRSESREEGKFESNGSAGRIDVFADSVVLRDNGQISNSTQARSNGDFLSVVTINANNINLDSGGNIFSSTSGNADAGGVAILGRERDLANGVFTDAESITITNGGLIDSSTRGGGSANFVHVQAEQIKIDGQGMLTGIFSDAEDGSSGNAFGVSLVADSLQLTNGGEVRSLTFGSGNAGAIAVDADFIHIDGESNSSLATGIFSSSESLASGSAGRIDVITDSLDVINGGAINTSTASSEAGDSLGVITVSANHINLDGGGNISSSTSGNADAGGVAISGRESDLANGVFADAESITITNGGFIDSSTSGSGNAGSLLLQAKAITIDGQGRSSSETGVYSTSVSTAAGSAGRIDVIVDSLDVINGGTINTATAGNSDVAGLVVINADAINLASGGNISSSTSGNADAGVIEVTTDSLNLISTGSISTLTSGQGDAGFVTINARTIEIDGQNNKSNDLTGITSSAQLGESKDFTEIGSAGVITIAGIGHTDSNPVLAETLHIKNRGGIVSFTEALNPVDYIGAIKISAENIYIETEGSINTSSSGINNAGIIEVNFQEMLFLGSSSEISTEANQGNGGDITIAGGEIVYLLDSAITTSVTGQTGNGGDISVSADSMIMQSGFIQANTVAVGASGGDVNIKVPVLVPSGGFLQTGGNTPFEFQPFSGINVIQAAAPDGVSGSITAASPQLNLSGVLTNLVVESFDSSTLSHNMCAVEQGSSLYQSGRGGLRMRARDFLLLPVY